MSFNFFGKTPQQSVDNTAEVSISLPPMLFVFGGDCLIAPNRIKESYQRYASHFLSALAYLDKYRELAPATPDLLYGCYYDSLTGKSHYPDIARVIKMLQVLDLPSASTCMEQEIRNTLKKFGATGCNLGIETQIIKEHLLGNYDFKLLTLLQSAKYKKLESVENIRQVLNPRGPFVSKNYRCDLCFISHGMLSNSRESCGILQLCLKNSVERLSYQGSPHTISLYEANTLPKEQFIYVNACYGNNFGNDHIDDDACRLFSSHVAKNEKGAMFDRKGLQHFELCLGVLLQSYDEPLRNIKHDLTLLTTNNKPDSEEDTFAFEEDFFGSEGEEVYFFDSEQEECSVSDSEEESYANHLYP